MPTLSEDVDRWFFCVDAEGDGRLSRQQVLDVLVAQFPIDHAKLEEAMPTLWERWDVDGSGYISKAELLNPDRGLMRFVRTALLREGDYVTTVGTYECHKYDGTKNKNDWHYVTIKAEGSQLRWSNRAGVSWMLTPRADGNLDVGKECPYYTNGHTVCQVVRNSTGSVTSLLGPWDEHYDAA